MTTTASQIQPGDYIVGDRAYAAGMLDFTVEAVTTKTFENGNSTVSVSVLSGPYSIPRLITYSATDAVTLGSDHARQRLDSHRRHYASMRGVA